MSRSDRGILMGSAPYGVVTPAQAFSWEISRLVVAVAVLDCNVSPLFTTARDDEKPLKSEWHGDGSGDGFGPKDLVNWLPDTSHQLPMCRWRIPLKAQGSVCSHGVQPPVSAAGCRAFLAAKS